jgi:AmmeMemoRadiSam system protein B/AmmeMemoRadiSam system protein A
MGSIRAAAVAGTFYSGDARELANSVGHYLAGAAKSVVTANAPKALIVPHAGYVYSGAIAGQVFASVRPAANAITRVVLLGPAHRVGFSGVAAPDCDAFETPLGAISLDRAAIEAVCGLSGVARRADAHRDEHSLEVQLPFLQTILGRFTLVPLVVGQCDATLVTAVLDQLWGGAETLIVISSDLSHYEDYDTAQGLDNATAAAIESLQPDRIEHRQACGRLPIAGLLDVARRRGMTVKRLGLCNSGDTAGDRNRVVGYGGWRLDEALPADDDALLARHGAELRRVAGQSIRHGMSKGKPPAVDVKTFAADLQTPRATFITLKKDGRLRGCVGTVSAHRPLINDVVANAYAAAFRDHRFAPLQSDELRGTTLSISLLGIPNAMAFEGEDDLKAQLRPGIDGLIIRDGEQRAVFLPQVWDELREPGVFLAHLKHKAGMTPDHWSDDFTAWRFTSTSI